MENVGSKCVVEFSKLFYTPFLGNLNQDEDYEGYDYEGYQRC